MSNYWHGDDTRVRQVLINLLGNAFKFTPSGVIRLEVKRSRDKSGLFFRLEIRELV